MCQGALGQITLATNTIHDLQVFATYVRETAQPVRKCPRFLSKTEYIQGVKRKSGIAQPRIPVIPVACPSKVFWQRGGRGSNDSTSWSIGHHLECERAAFHRLSIRTM